MSNNENQPEQKKLSIFQLVGSLFAGAIGVQSSKNRERDFQVNSIMPFVIGGLIFTGLFIGTIFTLINIFVK